MLLLLDIFPWLAFIHSQLIEKLDKKRTKKYMGKHTFGLFNLDVIDDNDNIIILY